MLTLATGETLRGVAGSASAITYTLTGDEKTTSDAFKVLAQGQLPAATASIYGPVAASTSALMQQMFFRNVTAGIVTMSLFINGTAGANQIIGLSLPASGSASYGSDGWKVYDSTGTQLYVGGIGPIGEKGWSPILAAVSNGSGGFVFQIVDWAGGVGTKPSVVNQFIGSAGIVGTAAAAQDIRGPAGAPGTSPNAFTTITGNTGTATADTASDSLSVVGTGSVNVVASDNPEVLTISNALATSTTVGNLSAAGFKKLAGYQDMVADWGFVGDDATDNLAAWNAFKGAVANNSILYFPPGTYRFSAEATLDQDKHLQFHGAGPYVSVLKTTSVAGNLINVTGTGGNAWYNTFTDLGFASSVTKTAGAHLGFNVAAAISCDVRRCAFSGHFIAIDYQGAQAGNVSVVDTVSIATPAVNGRGIRINGNTINMIISNSTINSGPTSFAVAGSANVEINQSGAVQVLGCDLIGGVNSVLLNANQGGGTSIAACYFTNTFFDQSGGSTVKITGANTTNRIKFTQCGIAAGLIGTHAMEIAGTGAGGVGSATAMPAGISVIDCDIYYAPGSSTAAGIFVNGCQDINIQNCRVAGFSGAGGAGIRVAGSASNQTKVRINGCIVGPNSNLTINNTVGVQIDAGSSALGALSITDNTLLGNGTAITDASAALSTATKNINNNQGAAAGLSGLAVPLTLVNTTVETIAAGMQVYLPANSIKVGTTIRWSRMDTTSVSTGTIEKARIGTLGTLTDATNISSTSVANGAAVPVFVEGYITFSTVGATAAFNGAIAFTQGAVAGGTPSSTVTGTVNTTTANFVTISAQNTLSAQRTIRSGIIEVFSPA